MQAIAPRVERAIARAADLLRDDERALSARARALAARAGGAPQQAQLARLRAAPVAVQRRVVRRAYRAAGGRGQLGAARVEEVLGLAQRDRPGRLALPGGLEARCRYGQLSIARPAAERQIEGPVAIPGPGRYALPDGAAGAAVVSAAEPSRVPWPLELRARRAGDRFRPEGGAGAKKLKGWLIDRKVPRERRDGLWLLVRGTEVLAIPELGARAQGTGPSGMGLEVRLEARPAPRSGCKGGAGLL